MKPRIAGDLHGTAR